MADVVARAPELLASPQGRRALLYLLVPRAPRHFTPAQTALLAAAMFALGCGVHVATLRKVGGRPVLLAVLSTVLVATVALLGPLVAVG